ncbi:triple tyrosine motif-containing protein [Salegentibacter sp. HM20]
MRYFLVFFLFGLSLAAQELPPVTNFDPATYGAGNQNWMATQNAENHIFIANNLGLLSYDGEHWRLNKVPNSGPLRSVLSSGQRIYSGGYMDFGFWEATSTGELKYSSLAGLSEEGMIDNEQFWHIEELDDYIVFQSLQRLFIFNQKSKELTSLAAGNIISNLFKLNGKLFFQVAEDGLYFIENGQMTRLLPNSLIQDRPLVGLFPFQGKMLAATRDDGLFLIEGNSWESYPVENYPLDESIFTAKLSRDENLILGSIGSGLQIFNLETSENYRLVQPVINNNTVLALFEDRDGNIWGGLDNGLVLINRESPFRLYTDIYGKLGTVYCSFKKGENLYLGTNQGLYLNSENSDTYELVPGTSGQVWSISEIYGNLLVGHDRGVFVIEGNSARHVFDGPGVWQIEEFKGGILQGHYDGLSFWKNDEFSEDPVYLENWDLSTRNFVIEDSSTLWVGHDHKGVYKIKIDEEVKQLDIIRNFELSSVEGMGLKVFQLNENIYYSTEDRIFKYNSGKDIFETGNELDNLLDERRISGISRVLPDNTWWSFGRQHLIYVSSDAFQAGLNLNRVALPLEFRTIAKGFESISQISTNEYLVGSNVGYAIFKTPIPAVTSPKLSLQKVATAALEDSFESRNLALESLSLPTKINNISFEFSIPAYSRLNKPMYSYRLKGLSAGWSDWQHTGRAAFENLPPGDYVFEVRGKLQDSLSNVESYAFSIAVPWYASNLAIVIYVLLFLLLIFLLHKLYSSYYDKQKARLIEENRKKLEIKQLESQQEIITLQNRQLETDVTSKNRELAASTMNLIKKNEFLNELKEQLSEAKNKDDIQKVISVINKNINEKDNWKLFKEAFDNADKDFLQSVKAAHPNLTSNDLKLCAYLRLNLSSKEIAPLLNISVRSVEIKRYRLRKKMELDHDQGLVEYILAF